MRRKKVFVSGCFDLLHTGHVRFLEQAAAYGDVYVGIGSDRTVRELKGRYPVCGQQERKYMLEALRHVKACFINRGSGLMDFLEEVKRLAPDYFLVNEDGNTLAKSRLCRRLGIKYLVLKRIPPANLPPRSTTSLRAECRIPYRIDLAGGWLDQPFVSRHAAGPVLTISIEPVIEFNERCGMATSTRRRALELWQTDIPTGDKEQLARVLFSYENPPGTTQFAGSQDAIGIVFPGLNRLDYNGAYWPARITSVTDARTLRWLEDHLHLVALGQRKPAYHVLGRKSITPAKVRSLASAASRCWDAILKRDLAEFSRQLRNSFDAQVSLFPRMLDRNVQTAIRQYQKQAWGWKLAGAGGGGYLVLAGPHDIPGSIKIKIRRSGL